jgi:Uma2 family endonuclease
MPRGSTIPTKRQSTIFYPESDGKPLGETGTHIDVNLTALDVLRRYYSPRQDVAILCNMFLYYVEGNPRKNVAPDLFVTLGVPANTKRRTFKVWEEGKGPDCVLEVTSKATEAEDLETKFVLYRDILKVREYFLLDPLDEYLNPPLQGYRLKRGRYTRIKAEAGRLPSEVLGLHLERNGLDLRLYNPETGRWESTSEEIEDTLREREAVLLETKIALREQRAASLQAQDQIEQLRREVDRLRREVEGGR